MDELYPVVREEIDDMAGCTGEMARIRMIHKNFKDEATRIRVQHITNLIETDIYEEANNELKVIRMSVRYIHILILAGIKMKLSCGVMSVHMNIRHETQMLFINNFCQFGNFREGSIFAKHSLSFVKQKP